MRDKPRREWALRAVNSASYVLMTRWTHDRGCARVWKDAATFRSLVDAEFVARVLNEAEARP